jgi:hypothetical protein
MIFNKNSPSIGWFAFKVFNYSIVTLPISFVPAFSQSTIFLPGGRGIVSDFYLERFEFGTVLEPTSNPGNMDRLQKLFTYDVIENSELIPCENLLKASSILSPCFFMNLSIGLDKKELDTCSEYQDL